MLCDEIKVNKGSSDFTNYVKIIENCTRYLLSEDIITNITKLLSYCETNWSS